MANGPCETVTVPVATKATINLPQPLCAVVTNGQCGDVLLTTAAPTQIVAVSTLTMGQLIALQVTVKNTGPGTVTLTSGATTVTLIPGSGATFVIDTSLTATLTAGTEARLQYVSTLCCIG